MELPFPNSAVVGNNYYATPTPGSPLRLRIDFFQTIRVEQYNGLRLATLHQEHGELDVAVLRFDDHKTFDHRDATRGVALGTTGYGTFTVFRDRPDLVPWRGAHTNGLRDAIEEYSNVWFPGAWKASAPTRTAARTASKAPPAPVTHGGRRAR